MLPREGELSAKRTEEAASRRRKPSPMKPPRLSPRPLGLSVQPGSKLKPAASPRAEAGYGPDDLARDCAVSRETVERLVTHRRLLEAWAEAINLVGPKELDEYWRRHALDCAQLVALAPSARHWVDLGAGAGFPGLVVAALLAGGPGAQVDLVEANAKKCAFLREAARAMAVPARVQFGRIESVVPGRIGACDVVCARALAPLSRLINHAKPLLDGGAIGLFPKGADWESELLEAGFVRDGGDYRRSDLTAEALDSRSDPRARVIRVRTV